MKGEWAAALGFGFAAGGLALAAGVGEPTPDAALAGAAKAPTESDAAAGRGAPGGFATLLMTSITLCRLSSNPAPMSSRSLSVNCADWK